MRGRRRLGGAALKGLSPRPRAAWRTGISLEASTTSLASAFASSSDSGFSFQLPAMYESRMAASRDGRTQCRVSIGRTSRGVRGGWVALLRGVVYSGAARRGAVWRGVAWRGVAWRGVEWGGVAWWRGVAWRLCGEGQKVLAFQRPQREKRTYRERPEPNDARTAAALRPTAQTPPRRRRPRGPRVA